MGKKYIDAEKLITLIDAKLEDLGMSGSVWVGRSVLRELRNDIISLQNEQPELPDNLDKVAEEYENTLWEDGCKDCGYSPLEVLDAFKAGAEWMAGR